MSIATEQKVEDLLERVKRLEDEIANLKAKLVERTDGRKK